jgi:hypothetical protein
MLPRYLVKSQALASPVNALTSKGEKGAIAVCANNCPLSFLLHYLSVFPRVLPGLFDARAVLGCAGTKVGSRDEMAAAYISNIFTGKDDLCFVELEHINHVVGF